LRQSGLVIGSQSAAKSCQGYEKEPEHGGDAAAGSADSPPAFAARRSAGCASQTQCRGRTFGLVAANRFEAHFAAMWAAGQAMIEFAPAIQAMEPR
jgi:hypothetical protein